MKETVSIFLIMIICAVLFLYPAYRTGKIMWRYNKLLAILGYIPGLLFIPQLIFCLLYEKRIAENEKGWINGVAIASGLLLFGAWHNAGKLENAYNQQKYSANQTNQKPWEQYQSNLPEFEVKAQKDIQRLKEHSLSLTDGIIVSPTNLDFYPDNLAINLEARENWWLENDSQTIYLHIVNYTPNPLNGVGVNLSNTDCNAPNKPNKPYYVKFSHFLLPNDETVVKFSGYSVSDIKNPNNSSCLIIFKSW